MPPSFAIALTIFSLGQAPETDAAPAVVKLTRGQELHYRGSVHEESSAAGSMARRVYDLESLAFVGDASMTGFKVALQTTLRVGDATAKPGSVRLEVLAGRPNGSLDWANATRPAVDGPPTLEPAGIVELKAGQWPVEYVRGTRCVRWTRTEAVKGGALNETVWVAAQTGIVRKLERTFDRTTGGARPTTLRVITTYELIGDLMVPEALTAGRRREIEQALAAQQRLTDAAKRGPNAYDPVLLKLTSHIDNQPATPYRAAVLWLRDRADAGRRGESPVAAP